MMSGWIYGLYDPREPDRIRYVGKTSIGVAKRHAQHCAYRSDKPRTRLLKWLMSLKNDGVRPGVLLLEEVADDLDAAECRWIAELPDLVNGTRGGTGGATRRGPLPDEAVQKMKASWTPERRAAVAERTRLRWKKINAGELPRPRLPQLTAEQRAEAGRRLKEGRKPGPLTEAQLAAARTNAVGKKRSEEQKATYRASWTPERRAAHAEKIRESRRKKAVQLAENSVL